MSYMEPTDNPEATRAQANNLIFEKMKKKIESRIEDRKTLLRTKPELRKFVAGFIAQRTTDD